MIVKILENIPGVNVQALVALFSFLLCLFLAQIIKKVAEGELPGGELAVSYLRVLLGFLFAAVITMAFYSFAGINILH